LQPWLAFNLQSTSTTPSSSSTTVDDPLVRMYAGPETLARLQTTYDALTRTLTEQYETAVANSDLQVLGQLTPILSVLQLEHEGLRLYKVYLDSILNKGMMEAVAGDKPAKSNQPPPPPYAPMGRVYNTAVSVLRHHLPMVSHCLYKADGAVAVVQLVHSHVERSILPILAHYQRDKQLARVARTAANIFAALEERCTGQQRRHGSSNSADGRGDEDASGDGDDCGFVHQIGSLADVDVSMEEVAVCIQHSESYFRFVQHTCVEVNRARRMRHEQTAERARMERERHEWTTGEKASTTEDENSLSEYKDLEILPASTNLVKAVAELGGQYASIERCLLLASMQRAFVSTNDDDPRSYRPMSTTSAAASAGKGGTPAVMNSGAGTVSVLQTTLVETCWYAARRGTQRAVATGHAGTASAVINFTVECLNDVCLEVLSRRAEDLGVHLLKPGEGLLVGSANLFNNASNLLIRQSAATTAGVGLQAPLGAKNKDEWMRKQKREEGVARACAVMNDLEVAVHHTQQLEALLFTAIEKGFAKDTHETEHLRMCIKSFSSVTDAFRLASNATIESLESVLKPRIRSIVGDAVGSDSSTFMGASSVMGVGGKSSDREMVRMNYDLDEETYNLMQLSEGYITRLCTQLDELLQPLHRHLAPRLWDTLLLTVLGTVCKRLETSLRKCQYTALGGLTLDSDMRDLLHYTKGQLHSPEYNGSNVAILKSCPALSKLLQIAKLLSVDDLDDVLDLISGAKRKGNWDLKLDDAKAFLSLRVEFDATKIDDLLRLPDDD
jgi:conserved oligomeric Golgi complex subunit 4